MDALFARELVAISGYIHKNYYKKLKKKDSLNRNTIIDNGIILIIHNYCKPLLLKCIDARSLSCCINDGYKKNIPDSFKELMDPAKYISGIKECPDNIKFVSIGAGAMGKTCLYIRYTTNAFPGEYIPTVFDGYSATVIVDGRTINLGLWDTAGGEDYARLRPLSYQQADVFLICMSVYDNSSNRSYLDKSGMWSNLAVHTMAFCQEAEAFCPLASRLLIGTKTDLRDDAECKDKCYKKEDMEMFAHIWGCHGYFECSALTGDNVKETFNNALKTAIKCRKELLNPQKSPKKDCVIL